MKSIILFSHIVIAISLITCILLQTSKGGLGASFTGGDAYRSKRGAERVVFGATIASAVLFLVTSIITLLV